MIGCSEAVRQLWEFLDGTVGEADRILLEEHLSRCRRCCAELEFADAMRRMLATAADDSLPDDVAARLEATLDGLEHG